MRITPRPGTQISCCICLNQRGTRTPAATLVHGYAVCDTHIDLASQPEFDIFTIRSKPRAPL